MANVWSRTFSIAVVFGLGLGPVGAAPPAAAPGARACTGARTGTAASDACGAGAARSGPDPCAGAGGTRADPDAHAGTARTAPTPMHAPAPDSRPPMHAPGTPPSPRPMPMHAPAPAPSPRSPTTIATPAPTIKPDHSGLGLAGVQPYCVKYGTCGNADGSGGAAAATGQLGAGPVRRAALLRSIRHLPAAQGGGIVRRLRPSGPTWVRALRPNLRCDASAGAARPPASPSSARRMKSRRRHGSSERVVFRQTCQVQPDGGRSCLRLQRGNRGALWTPAASCRWILTKDWRRGTTARGARRHGFPHI